jgi:PAS domain S-box-containing protein
MKKSFKIMFLSDPTPGFSWMAETFFKAMAEPGFEAGSAVLKEGSVASAVVEVMKEIGLAPAAPKLATVPEFAGQSFDAVITIDHLPSPASLPEPLLVGDPNHIHWKIPVESDPGDSSAESIRRAARKVREEIKSRVQAFVSQGFLTALALQRGQLTHIVDAIEDGLIVHDQSRHIFLFNRAAERITGYSREEVLGRNCHEIFAPDGICSSLCPFSEQPTAVGAPRDYEVSFTTRSGEDRRLRMWVTALPDQPGRGPSVLAILRDVTEFSELRFKLREKYSFHGMAGRSEGMQEIFRTIRQVTTSDYPVLISGESGTGKELVARAIHNESRRKGGPFVPINCGALPETILESELFGHVRGAFTGAIRAKKGRFELAHGGTLFLDEVGELSPGFQVKLLRVLQEKRFEPVGGEETIAVDVRVIAATNQDLRQQVGAGKFREDLFYRLAVVPVTLPPLRDRHEDLPMLVEQILADVREDTGKKITGVSDAAMEALLAYRWPGNVRELINALQFASVRCAGEVIDPGHLPPEVRGGPGEIPGTSPLAVPVDRRRNKLDAARVKRALSESGGNRLRAAKLLGVGRATLYRFLDHGKE